MTMKDLIPTHRQVTSEGVGMEKKELEGNAGRKKKVAGAVALIKY